MIESKTTHLSMFKQKGQKTKSTSSRVDVCQLWPMSGSLNNWATEWNIKHALKRTHMNDCQCESVLQYWGISRHIPDSSLNLQTICPRKYHIKQYQKINIKTYIHTYICMNITLSYDLQRWEARFFHLRNLSTLSPMDPTFSVGSSAKS